MHEHSASQDPGSPAEDGGRVLRLRPVRTTQATQAVEADVSREPSPEGSSTAQDRRPAAGASRLPLALLWAVALVVVLLDQVTKVWALASLEAGHRVALLGRVLGLTLVRNPGAAFSIASGQTWVFSLIAIIVTVVVIRVSQRLASRAWAVALGLVLGGAVGNLIDRLVRSPGFLRGHVIDFIDYAGYFVGNVADIAIVAAAGTIIVLSLGGWEMDGTRSTGREGDPAQEPDLSTLGPRRRARLRGTDEAQQDHHSLRDGQEQEGVQSTGAERRPQAAPSAPGEPGQGTQR